MFDKRRRPTDETILFLLLLLIGAGFFAIALIAGTAAAWLAGKPPQVGGLPADITIEATGASGAVVSWSLPSGRGVLGRQIAFDCAPVSGTVFSLGDHSVNCSLTSRTGDLVEGSFEVSVEDTTPPVLSIPSTIRHTLNQLQMPIDYSVTAFDVVDGNVPVTCDPPPGSMFPPGETDVHCSATDHSGNSIEGDFSVVLADLTPPKIAPDVVGTQGSDGWYTSTVTVRWNVSDPESGIASSDGCDPAVIDADTEDSTFTCSATSAGGTNSRTVTIKRDATPPTITWVRSPEPNQYGWWNGDVTLSFNCLDDVSGVTRCPPPEQVVTTEGAGQSVTVAAFDGAGNEATTTVRDINIDKTPPAVAADVSSQPNENGWYRSIVTISLRASDNPGASGMQAIQYSINGGSSRTVPDSTAFIPMTADGVWTIGYNAIDRAGNESALRDITIQLDKTPPAPVAEAVDPQTQLYQLTSTDNVSGLAALFFQVVPFNQNPSDNSWSVYIDPIPHSCPAAGTFTLWAYSVDQAGNANTPASIAEYSCPVFVPQFPVVPFPPPTFVVPPPPVPTVVIQ